MDKIAFVLWSVLWPLACEISAYLGVKKRQIKNEPQRTEEEEKSGNGVLLAIWVIVAILLWNTGKSQVQFTHFRDLTSFNQHRVMTTGLAWTGTIIGYKKTGEMWKGAVIGFSCSMAIGTGKEVSDMAGFGSPSWKDMAGNLVGSLVGSIAGVMCCAVQEEMFYNRQERRANKFYNPLKP